MKITAATRALTALAQETRLGIVRLLVKVGPDGLVAGQIAQRLKLAPATSSFHLSQLTQAGLIQPTREGRSIRYTPVLPSIDELLSFLGETLSGGATRKSAGGRERVTPKPAPRTMPVKKKSGARRRR